MTTIQNSKEYTKTAMENEAFPTGEYQYELQQNQLYTIMNTIEKADTPAANTSNVTCINCGADFNTNSSPECPCCGLHYRAMTCQKCGENFFPPENVFDEHYQTCPHCGGVSFRPFYFKGITEYPLTGSSLQTQYPATEYPDPLGPTTDYPFIRDKYPIIFDFHADKQNPGEQNIATGKEYPLYNNSSQYYGENLSLRLRGLRLLCNTSRLAEGTRLRMLLRDRKSCQFLEKEITLERKAEEECLFDFEENNERFFTRDIVVSFKLVREDQECARELTVRKAKGSLYVQWTDKNGNIFLPVLTLYGYKMDIDTGEQELILPTTEYPETDYPTTEYPETDYPSTEYPITAYPTPYSSMGGNPSLGNPVIIYPEPGCPAAPDIGVYAPTFFEDSLRSDALYWNDNREYIPQNKYFRKMRNNGVDISLESILKPDDSSDIPECVYVDRMDLAMEESSCGELQQYDIQSALWLDNFLLVDTKMGANNVLIVDLKDIPEEHKKLSGSTHIKIRFQGRHKTTGQWRLFSEVTFKCNLQNRIFACINGKHGKTGPYPPTMMPTTDYPTTAFPTPYPTWFPTTGYLSSDNFRALSPGIQLPGTAKAAVSPTTGYPTTEYPGPGDVPPAQGKNNVPETDIGQLSCPTTAFPSPGNTGTEEGEAGTDISFGGGGSGSGLPSGNISMISPSLGVEMASPSVLTYRHISQRHVGGFNSPTGLIQNATQVCVFTERGFPRFTDFSRNPDGERTDRSLTLPEQLRKITIETDDGSGLPVLSSCFEEILGDGTILRYSLTTGEVAAMKAVNGPWVTAEKLKEDLHIVYENKENPSQPVSPREIANNIYSASAERSGRIRQIWSRSDGLLDIVVQNGTSYEIRWYAPEDTGSYNGSLHLYPVRSGAAPVKVWAVEATLIDYEIRSDGKKYERDSGRLLTEDDLKYLRKLRVTERRGNLSFVTEWEQPNSTTLIFTRGEGEEAETTVTRRTATSPATYAELLTENSSLDATFLELGGVLTREIEETRTVPGIPGGTRMRIRRYPFGDVVVFHEEGTGADHPSTVTYEYDTSQASRTYGCCTRETYSSGRVVTKNYDAQKRLLENREQWAGGTFKMTRYTYDSKPERLQRMTSVTESLIVGGREKAISRTAYAYSETPEVHEEKVTRIGLGSPGVNGIPHPEISLTQWYGPDPETNGQACAHAAGRMKMRRDAAGVQYDYLYQNGTYAGIAYVCFVTKTFRGDVVQGLSTSVSHYYDELGREVGKCEYAHTGETFTLVNEEKYTFDSAHRIVRTDLANGRHTESTWICRGPLQEKDEYGVQTRYEYNSAKKLVRETRDATPYIPQPGAPVQTFSLPARTTEYVYDTAGREIRRKVSTGNMAVTTSTEWDALGRVKSRTDETGRKTRYEYSADGLQTTSISPTGATLVTRNHTDGNVLSETGTGRQACYYSYSCNNWELETHIRLNAPNGPLTKQLFTGGKGQTIYTKEARGTGELTATLYRYNTAGQLVGRREEGHPEVVTYYDALGNVSGGARTRLLPRRHLTTLEEKRYVLGYQSCGGDFYPRPGWTGQELVWLRTVRSSYLGNDRSRAIEETRWELVSRHLPNVQEILVSEDKYGRRTSAWKEVISGNEYLYTSADGGKLKGCTMTLDGRTVWERNISGEQKTYSYTWMADGTLFGTTDGRGNTVTQKTDLGGRVVSETDGNGNRTTFSYDPATGLLTRQTNAMGGTTEYRYDDRGRLKVRYGTAVQPLRFEYDEADRMTALHTWRVPGGALSSSPLDRTDGDVTRWTYDAASGVLVKKTMADGKSVSYGYDGGGKMTTLLRSGGRTVRYLYEAQSDLLMKIRYDDGTPGVTFTRNEWGDLLSVTDAAGIREYKYNGLGDLEEDHVTAPYDTRICPFRDTRGREGGYWFFAGGDSCQKVNLTYGDDLRLYKVTLDDKSPYVYGWNASGLPATVTEPEGMVKEWTYEAHRDNIVGIHYAMPGGRTLTTRENAFDSLGRLTYRRNPADGSQRHDYSYNVRSEVTGDTLSGGGHWTYAYDNLGNRITSGEARRTRSYAVNNLNQYTDITGPDGPFTPAYDADGNQTLAETGTGEWQIKWNAENRPILFTRGNERIECLYDFMGRRTRKVHTRGSDVVSHLCYVYNGYKLVAELDSLKTPSRPQVVKTWLWDPSRDEDSSPLEINDWRKEEEFPTTDYPTTDYPTTAYPTTDYPTTDYSESTYFATTDRDLIMNDRKPGAFIATTYEDEGLVIYFPESYLPEGKAACIDKVEFALDGSREELAGYTYRATVLFRNPVTMYADLDGDILSLDLTGLAESTEKIVPDSRKLIIPLEKRAKNTPDANWEACQWIPYYLNDWSGPPVCHVIGVLIDRASLPVPVPANKQTLPCLSSTEEETGMTNKGRSVRLSVGYPQMDPPYPTFYPMTEYAGPCSQYSEETFFPGGEDTLWIRSGNNGKKWCLNLTVEEVVVNVDSLTLPEGDLIVDGVEITMERQGGTLTAVIYIDEQTPKRVEMINTEGRIHRIDLKGEGVPENQRTLKGKREIVIRLLNGNTMTVWADSRERPYVHIKGRIKPRAKEKTRYYCLTDHNKNVTGLADGNGTIRATWDYDAFGNCITQSGDKAEWNPVKYSSEYHDKELDLIYYNYRHYNPKDGRWISRDLIEEKGGYNLYCFANNNINKYDYMGLSYEKTELDDYTIEYHSWDGGDESGILVYKPDDLFLDFSGLPFGCCNIKMSGKIKFKILLRADLSQYGNQALRDSTISHELNHFKDFREIINAHIERVKKYEGCQCNCSKKTTYINASVKVMEALLNLKNVELDLQDYEHGSKAWLNRLAQHPDKLRKYNDAQTSLNLAASKL